MQDQEEFYDREIAPALLELAKKCESRGVPFVALCQYSEADSSYTAYVPEGAGPVTRLTHYAAQCHGNVDLLFESIRRDAEVHGHDSAILELLLRLKKQP